MCGLPYVAITDAAASSVKENGRVFPVQLSTVFVVCLVALQSRVFSIFVLTVLLMSFPQREGRGSVILFLTDVVESSTHQRTGIVFLLAVTMMHVRTELLKERVYV